MLVARWETRGGCDRDTTVEIWEYILTPTAKWDETTSNLLITRWRLIIERENGKKPRDLDELNDEIEKVFGGFDLECTEDEIEWRMRNDY